MVDLSDLTDEPEPIDVAHLAAVVRGLTQAKRREFAKEEEVEAVFRRFDMPDA